MTQPSVWWAVTLWSVAGACLLGAVLFGGFAVLGFSIDHHMETRGVTTSATVTDVADDRVSVEFTTADERWISTAFTWWPTERPTAGDRIDITYDSEDPYYVVKAGSPEDQVMATVFAVLALYALAVTVGAFVGAVLIHRARAGRRAFPGTPWAAAG